MFSPQRVEENIFIFVPKEKDEERGWFLLKKEVFSLKEKGTKRKDFAQLVKNNDFSFLYFLMYDNSQLNFLDWENKISYKKMVKYYELI